ncbi:MAG: hypothetical protein SFW35_01560 [Chitinophagales bacterium]|nr:hypothetical protein [Chitinophagales bacterium]
MIEVEYAEQFLKDTNKLKKSTYYLQIYKLCFEEIPNLDAITSIKALKKLKGHKTFYRIRQGELRIGIEIIGSKIIFLRCLSRKDIYRYFP